MKTGLTEQTSYCIWNPAAEGECLEVDRIA